MAKHRPPAEPPPARIASGGPSRSRTLIPLLLLLALFLQGLAFITESSQTSDEAAHLAAGYSYLTTADFRLNPEHPPLLKELAALPLLPLHLEFPWGPLWEQGEEWNLGRLFVHENRVPNDTLLLLGRLPMLLLSLLLGWTIYRWGRRLFGERGALLALALYVFDPNVVAHSCLVTTDLGVTLFIFLTVYALWAWSESPTPGRLALTGLAAGGAFASKFTALWLLPIVAGLALALLLTGAPIPVRPWSAASPIAAGGRLAPRRIGGLAMALLLIALLASLVVVATYAVIGLPAFWVGLRRGLQHSEMGHTAYLMGQYSETGWWYYFLFAYLIKTPIGTLIVVALSLLALGAGRRRPLRDELFLWLPILLTIGITCLWKVNIGLRHLLPIYPFLYISAGRLLASRPAGAPSRRGRLARLALPVVGLCCAWNVVEAVHIAPYDLAYFNELVGGPANGHRYLLDSNLDWGQSAKALRRYMQEQRVPMIYCAFSGNSDPWYYGVRYQYVPGSGNFDAPKRRPMRMPEEVPRELLAVSAMVLYSVHFTDHDLYAWLRDRRPIAMPGYSYLVYDITGDAMMHAYLAVVCLNFGLPELADFEAQRSLRYNPDNQLARAVLEKLRQDRAAAGP
jgi:Dolichyl-phosphate-mannose-protein mannosyltransferase